MITEILAYITVGLIVIGWIASIIFDLIKKIQTNTKNKVVKTD